MSEFYHKCRYCGEEYSDSEKNTLTCSKHPMQELELKLIAAEKREIERIGKMEKMHTMLQEKYACDVCTARNDSLRRLKENSDLIDQLAACQQENDEMEVINTDFQAQVKELQQQLADEQSKREQAEAETNKWLNRCEVAAQRLEQSDQQFIDMITRAEQSEAACAAMQRRFKGSFYEEFNSYQEVVDGLKAGRIDNSIILAAITAIQLAENTSGSPFLAELEALRRENEKMKCCGNCKYETYDGMDYGCGITPVKDEKYKCLSWKGKE